jgi:hypothetical protein
MMKAGTRVMVVREPGFYSQGSYLSLISYTRGCTNKAGAPAVLAAEFVILQYARPVIVTKGLWSSNHVLEPFIKARLSHIVVM